MVRYFGPDNGSAYVFLPTGKPAVGRVAEAFSDEDGTVLADILDGTRDQQGDPVDTITVDATGRLNFWFPDGQPVVWVSVNNGPLVRVTADLQDQIEDIDGGGPGGGITEGEAQDLIDASVSTHNADTTAVHGIADTSVLESTTGAQAKANAAQAAAIASAASDATTKANAAIATAASDATTKANAAQAAAISTASSDATAKANTAQSNAAADATSKVSAHAAATDPHGDRAYSDGQLTAGLAGKADLVGGKVPTSQIPSYAVTDVFTVASQAAMLALTAERGDMAVRTDSGHRYVLSTEPASTLGNWVDLGAATDAVSSVNGQTGIVVLAKGDVGLGNVDNTTDAGKPVSSATQTALNLKAPLASPTFTGTVAGITAAMVGLGSVDNTSDAAKPVSTATQTALNLKAPLASPAFTGTPTGITATHVGLGNVNNTSDANKPVSTAQQTALDLKSNLASPTFTGTPAGPTAAQGTNTTQFASTAYVQTEVGLLVPKSLYSGKGVILAGSAANTPGALAAGTNGDVLTLDSAQTLGVKWATPSGGGGGTPDSQRSYPKTGLWYRAPQNGPVNSSANLTMTQNRLYMVPFRVGLAFTAQAIGFELVTVGGASAVCRMGIFNADATNLLPGTLVLDAGTVQVSATTGTKSITISQAFAVGVFWLGIVLQGNTGAVVRAITANDPLIPYFGGANAITGTEAASSVFSNGVTGALASTPTLNDNDRGPMLSVRAS